MRLGIRKLESAKPEVGYILSLYPSMSLSAVSSVLTRHQDKVLNPVYYVSKALVDTETRYLKIEKLAPALIV